MACAGTHAGHTSRKGVCEGAIKWCPDSVQTALVMRQGTNMPTAWTTGLHVSWSVVTSWQHVGEGTWLGPPPAWGLPCAHARGIPHDDPAHTVLAPFRLGSHCSVGRTCTACGDVTTGWLNLDGGGAVLRHNLDGTS